MKSALPAAIQDALASTSCSVVVSDATRLDNPIIYVNDAFTKIFGYARSEAIGRNCRFLQGAGTDPAVREQIGKALAAGTGTRCEILNYCKDGTAIWNDVAIDPIYDAAGLLIGFVGVQRQADPARLAAAAQAEAEIRLASITDHIPGYIYRRVLRSDGSIDLVYGSPSLSKMLEVDERDALANFYTYVHQDDRQSLIAAIRASAANLSLFREEFRLISASGVVHWLRSDAPPRQLPNGEIVWDGLAVEIGAERRWQNEISDLAFRDPLTNLLSREAWRSAVAVQLEGAPGAFGLIYCDIVAFHDFNQRFGARTSDDVLRQVAQRLATVAASVGGVAARLSGDEFAILFPSCGSDGEVMALAEIAAAALDQLFQVDQQELRIRTCIGASFHAAAINDAKKSDDAVNDLTAHAEIALRQAKRTGGSVPVLYSPSSDERFQNQAILAGTLEYAIADDQLELHYQPQVDLGTGRIVSAEALVRWKHPTLGLVQPDMFIGLAEKMGLIVQLGQWVLETALAQRGQWQRAGLTAPRIAINVSGDQLASPGFVARVERTLRAAGAGADGLELELTENLLIESSPQIVASLTALRKLGVTIAIDDFGSGHASFRYLRDFPVDKLKIDPLFVRKLVIGSTDALIIRAIISLARAMGISFVAEGIETEMQRGFLQREGCKIGQGYLFSMPLVAEDFAWLLANNVRLPQRTTAAPPPAQNDHSMETFMTLRAK